MTTAADLVDILESTISPKKLMTIEPNYVAPIYGAAAVIKVAGTFHGTVELALYLMWQQFIHRYILFIYSN